MTGVSAWPASRRRRACAISARRALDTRPIHAGPRVRGAIAAAQALHAARGVAHGCAQNRRRLAAVARRSICATAAAAVRGAAASATPARRRGCSARTAAPTAAAYDPGSICAIAPSLRTARSVPAAVAKKQWNSQCHGGDSSQATRMFLSMHVEFPARCTRIQLGIRHK
jgi:hypothetical protein